MPSNTVPAVLKRFLNNPHREQFMEDNNLTLAQAAVVFFRRHTNSKLWYSGSLWIRYGSERYGWWEIPVDMERVLTIRPATLIKYQEILNSLV